ncbi:ATP-binding cassette domain-containing protein [Sulfoacidibacillus thermotolerans]|uniref:ATP-binding cassette domain-containing protein n=1 Tax=Sulfoacidibacillus thermotolerans TaxID=1765684 RepID=UPI0015E7FB0C|nr:ATP-binding cassette domain-containing protein [Sulfoacidibacillus thermotolerans]
MSVYQSEEKKKILDDLTCRIEDQKITLVVGKTGSGKSTFIDVLSGLISLDEGSVYYDDEPLWIKQRVNTKVLRRLGNVFQFPEQQLFARTVVDEFTYSLRPFGISNEEVQHRTQYYLEQLGLAPALAYESPFLLSEGQKRRVALATTFSTEPQWLFLDEPTAGLDPSGTVKVIEYLLDWKKRSAGGMVITTHDLDNFLPIADHILVLQAGKLVANLTPRALFTDPTILLQAEVGIPAQLDLLIHLRELGFHVPAHFLSAKTLAELIQTQLAQGNCRKKTEKIHVPILIDATISESAQSKIAASQQTHVNSLIYDLDPRVKWGVYLLFAIGIFAQTHFAGLVLAGFITIGLIYYSRVPFYKIAVISKPFFILMTFSFLLSGIRFGNVALLWHIAHVGFSFRAALYTFFQLTKIGILMGLGTLLSSTMSQLKMKASLEHSLSFLRYMKIPVEALSLATMLTLRFIPVIMRETGRFSRIIRARKKKWTKHGTLHLRDLPALLIPLLLSVLQLGSHFVIAMEARGYRKIGQLRTTHVTLSLCKRDLLAMLFGIVVLSLLLALR